MSPAPDRVAAVSAAWLWYPPEARTLRTDDLLLVDWPGWFAKPPSLLWVAPTAAPERVIGDALAQARAWGHDEVVAWVKLDAQPGLERTVLDRGGQPQETLDVFALDLSVLPGGPALDPPPEVTVRWVDDAASLRDSLAVDRAAFDEGTVPDDEQIRALAARAATDLLAGTEAKAVGYLADRPVGSGGLTMAGDVALVWGGGVVPWARKRGVYRAVLAARLDRARAAGATMALVKGRVETSGPVLRRAGFASYGQERSYLLPVAGPG